MSADAARRDRRHPVLGGASWLVGATVTVAAGVLARRTVAATASVAGPG